MSAPARRVTPTATLVLPASADRSEWLAARRGGIGSSDVAAIMGVSAYGTAGHVYHTKRGDLPEDDDAGEAALWGTLHEETVAREWARRNRSVVRRVGVVAHVDDPWRMCTLDRRVTECPLSRDVRERCALEVKTRNAFVAPKWRRDVPDDVLAQVLWQIGVTGYDHIHLALLLGGNDYRQFVIRLAGNEQLLADLIAIAGDLWERIQAGRPPVPTGDPDLLVNLYDQLHPARGGTVRVDDDATGVLGDLRDYEIYRLTERDARTAKEGARARLVGRLGGAEVAVMGNQLAFSYEATARRTTDLERLAERWPDAYADCVTDTPSRRLSIGTPYRLKEIPDDVPA